DPTKTYQLNDQSEDIKNINALLNVLGYDVSDTDVFTEATQRAVEHLQEEHDIEQTGQMNETTAIRLMQDVRDYISENDKQLKEAVEQLNQ
ncbi:MAG TPA: peptidoglycan-binding domain-containing protein, partial [Alloiococcus sp.]|nr:peptidoglycan-binding domain-containing protein [Alloiococcus sp.]